MEAGRLRYLIEIQDYAMLQDSNGDDIKQYSVFATVHADIISSGGRELFAAQQQFSEAEAIIKIRYLEGVDARMRIYHAAEDKFYDIINVKPDGLGRRTDMIITCKTGLIDNP